MFVSPKVLAEGVEKKVSATLVCIAHDVLGLDTLATYLLHAPGMYNRFSCTCLLFSVWLGGGRTIKYLHTSLPLDVKGLIAQCSSNIAQTHASKCMVTEKHGNYSALHGCKRSKAFSSVSLSYV